MTYALKNRKRTNELVPLVAYSALITNSLTLLLLATLHEV